MALKLRQRPGETALEVTMVLVAAGVVAALVLPFSALAVLWWRLEERHLALGRARRRIERWARIAMLSLMVLVSSYALLTAMFTGSIRQLTRFGRDPKLIAARDDPLIFLMYVALWSIVWLLGIAWAGYLWSRRRSQNIGL